jgi:hypothetical protein
VSPPVSSAAGPAGRGQSSACHQPSGRGVCGRGAVRRRGKKAARGVGRRRTSGAQRCFLSSLSLP